jgi:sulfur carrier protein
MEISMSIIINGSRRDLISGTTIQHLLHSLKMEPDRVAVELNRTILPKADFEKTVLQNGDCVEIVQFVGGG